jgi:hypothetical protein
MTAVDDTDRIRVFMADGSSRDIEALIAWNRRQDWAVMAMATGGQQPFAAALPDSTNVGDRCFTMEGGPTGGRVLLEGTISGKGGAGAGPRLLATFFTGSGMPGAPVLNEFGELIGIVGGGHVPGATIDAHQALSRGAAWRSDRAFRVGQIGGPREPASMTDHDRESIPALAGRARSVGWLRSRRLKRETTAPSEQREDFPGRRRVAVFTRRPRTTARHDAAADRRRQPGRRRNKPSSRIFERAATFTP